MRYSDEYLEYLHSEHWHGLRSVALERAGNRCEACRGKRGLQGHHMIYRRPLNTGTADDIMALCDDCHERWHVWLKSTGTLATVFDRKMIVGALLVIKSGCKPQVRRERTKKHKAKVRPTPAARPYVLPFRLPPHINGQMTAREIRAALREIPQVVELFKTDRKKLRRLMRKATKYHSNKRSIMGAMFTLHVLP